MKSPTILAAEAAAKRAADKYVSRDGVPKAAPRTKVEAAAIRASPVSREIGTVAQFIMERHGDPWKPGRIPAQTALRCFSELVNIPLAVLYEAVGPTVDAARESARAAAKAKRDAKKAVVKTAPAPDEYLEGIKAKK